MTLNGQQLAALVKMGIAMALADGKVEEVEHIAIAHELIKFGVSTSEAESIISNSQRMEAGEAFATLSSMTNEQKKYATGYLAFIMVSDGRIDDAEVKMWQLICTLSGFPTMNAQEALSFWDKH
ncbi:MAG: TerB family tellurite resistance protein [Prevotella sp.]|nr:TerB family tellurite resistance protein [Prevotella sp.]